MNYQVTEKQIPAMIVYSSEVSVRNFDEMMEIIPELGKECMALNPDLCCAEPPYEFCEWIEGGYRGENVRICHSEAVERMGISDGRISFRTLPEAKVLSIFHRGPYEGLNQVKVALENYAEENGFAITGPVRECYIDGVWNCESEEEYLTELQLPVR